MTVDTNSNSNKPLIDRRSGEERRSAKPRRKENRWEPHKSPRRQLKDRRKENLYNSDLDSN